MTIRRTVSTTQFFAGIAIVIFACFHDNDVVVGANPLPTATSTAQKKILNNIHNTRSFASTTTLPAVAFLTPRGGGSVDVDDDSEYDFDESEEVEEEEEEETVQVKATKLSSSAVKASQKATSKKVKASKKIVNESLGGGTKKKAKKTSTTSSTSTVSKKAKKKLIYIPYIIKALLNPFTVFSMTKGYFASLFNIDYLQQDTSQTLRSALQEKAKKESGGPKRPSRGRKMRPGQAKTLSDLPQLSA
eukprot:CAMPEP_0203640000 /NCGR_PEP_ID=MMETSP0088-20131115/5612_1 /ASSEMBLY_ACC=CAM_ASM_001087 /TAXON_ID=426623 /ORGANISM="Chaetoceros affinis, Strain CCMP159" /LENGTH=245 /DNA_ID=CAMNT_0050495059 /DNA_START=211 /DNA_END=948 /DNA_ORIENTATION=-